jgi:putative methyltransferase
MSVSTRQCGPRRTRYNRSLHEDSGFQTLSIIGEHKRTRVTTCRASRAALCSTRGFARDDHIPSLLAFHPQARLIDEPAYQTGKVILQDKASCFPAVILAPPATENSLVIDATAAPGNKTSHLSALMHNKGKVVYHNGPLPKPQLKAPQLLAFERDRKRFATLKTMITKAHCENVDLVNADFLNTDPMDPKYSGVTHMSV